VPAEERATEAMAPSQGTNQTEAELPNAEVPAVPRSKLPLIGLGVAVVVVFSIVGVLAFSSSGPERPVPPPQIIVRELQPRPKPKPVAEVKPPEPKPEVKPPEPKPVAEVKPPEPKPEAEVKPPEPKPEAKPPEPKPEKKPVAETKPEKKPVKRPARVVTQDQLDARVIALKARLAKKEAEVGAPDRIVRQFLKQGEAKARAASTDAERREAWKLLDDIAAQLGGG